jgi:hypothetical protein
VKMSMEELMTFFQGGLEKDFGYGDDQVIESLHDCMEELRRAGMDLPPPPTDDSERPLKPFGVFVPPTIEQMIGRRSTMIADGETQQDGMLLIPADGGPVLGPVHSATAENRLSSVASSSILDKYETATDGFSSRRISVRDGRSSVTSFVDDFLDIEDEGGSDTRAVSDNMDLEVDNIDFDGDMDVQRNWTWNGADQMPVPDGFGTSLTETNSKFGEARSPEKQESVVDVPRSTSGVVTLNQPVSVINVVSGESEQSTPTFDPRSTSAPRYVTTVHTGSDVHAAASGDAMVRDFFDTSTASSLSQYMRVREYLSPTAEQRPVKTLDYYTPTTQTWSSYTPPLRSQPTSRPVDDIPGAASNSLSASINLRRREFFSNSSETVPSSLSYRPLANGNPLQPVRHYPIVLSPIGTLGSPSFPSPTVQGRLHNASVPSFQSALAEPVVERGEYATVTSRPAVLNITSKVVSPTGRVVGSTVTYPNAGISSAPKQVYKSSISMQVADKSIEMRYM